MVRADKLRETLRDGIGGDVSFGSGMLMVVRVGFHRLSKTQPSMALVPPLFVLGSRFRMLAS